MQLFSVTYTFMLALLIFLSRDVVFTMASALVLLPCLVSDYGFINIFTANLYEQHNEAVLNASVPFTSVDLETVSIHTYCYILLLLGNTLLMGFMATQARRFWPKAPIWLIPVLLFGMACVGIGSVTMLSHIDEYPNDYLTAPGQSFIEHSLNSINSLTKLSLWHWLPVLVYRFLCLPKQLCLQFSIQRGSCLEEGGALDEGVSTVEEDALEEEGAAEEEDERHHAAATALAPHFHPITLLLRPSAVISGGFALLAGLVFFSLTMKDPPPSESTILALGAGFRQKPYA